MYILWDKHYNPEMGSISREDLRGERNDERHPFAAHLTPGSLASWPQNPERRISKPNASGNFGAKEGRRFGQRRKANNGSGAPETPASS